MAVLIWKTIGVVLTYGTYILFLYSYGLPGILIALFCGTTVSSVILLARRNQMRIIAVVATRSLIGAILGFFLLGEFILFHFYIYNHGFGEADISAIAGAVIGVFLAALVSRVLVLLRSSHLNPSNDEKHLS